MMNIREYFNNLYTTATTTEDWDKVEELENMVADMEDEEFTTWAAENNIDLTATEMVMGEEIKVSTLWMWDLDD